MKYKFLIALMLVGVFGVPAAAFASYGTPPPLPVFPKILSLHIASDNASSTIAPPGSTVTFTMTTNESIFPPVVLVNNNPLFAKVTGSSTSWQATYVVGKKEIPGKIAYAITLWSPQGLLYFCTSIKFVFFEYCPTTDGSSVVASSSTPPVATSTPTTTPSVIGIKSLSFASPVINLAGEHAASFTLQASTTVPLSVFYTLTDSQGLMASGTASTTAGGVFTLAPDISYFADGTITLAANVFLTNNHSATSTTTTRKDTLAPMIATSTDISLIASSSTSTGAVVTYTTPTALDAQDGTTSVSCTPSSGSTFGVGTTTVVCSSQDAAGNLAASSFKVVVNLPAGPVVLTPFIMASQPDESSFCATDWNNCFASSSVFVTNLGIGSSLNQGSSSIYSLTIAKDENSQFVNQPWIFSIQCFTDSAYTIPCTNWMQPNNWNGHRTDILIEPTSTSTDNKHWTAYFTNPNHESNFNDSFPPVFISNDYYQLTINDNGWNIGAYGSQTLHQIYWVLTGLH